jgi:hypothetical protein
MEIGKYKGNQESDKLVMVMLDWLLKGLADWYKRS